jgi:hypothetical protein
MVLQGAKLPPKVVYVDLDLFLCPAEDIREEQDEAFNV